MQLSQCRLPTGELFDACVEMIMSAISCRPPLILVQAVPGVEGEHFDLLRGARARDEGIGTQCKCARGDCARGYRHRLDHLAARQSIHQIPALVVVCSNPRKMITIAT